MSRTRLVSALVLLAMAAGTVMAAPPAGLKLYVSPGGNDRWTGRTLRLRAPDGPFATLERARDEIRALKKTGPLPPGGVTVELQGGSYELARTFELTADDSGAQGAPVTYRAAPGQQVRVAGGKVLTGWQIAADQPTWQHLDPAARGKVYCTDLRAQGVTDFGVVGARPGASGVSLVELFFNDQPMTLARWPNEGFVTIKELVGGAPHRIHGLPGDKIGAFTFAGDRWKRWLTEKEPWLHGYWFWDWADGYERVESFDPQTGVIRTVPPYHSYGYRAGQRFYALNMLSEIDTPGEWFLDRDAGRLYFWPPGPVERGHPTLSVLPNLVTMRDVSGVTLQGLTLEAARGTAVTITGGSGDRVAACTLRNLGGFAVTVAGGTNHGVVGCDIYYTGDGGIILDGGDRKTLAPAGHYADNNHIHHYSRINRICKPAIGLYGVGNRASHNLIHDAPHIAILFGGNDHVIEYNEIHSVLWEVNDAGAIYAGRDWTMRGTVIRYNYIHHVYGPRLHQDPIIWGIYLDDMFCGTTIYGNIFYELTRGARIAGGRDCTIENNIFVNCNPAVEVHSVGVWDMAAASIAQWKKMLTADPFHQRPPYDRYPGLANILENEPELALGNVIARNVWQGGKWAYVQAVDKNKDGVWVTSSKVWQPGDQPAVLFQNNLLDGDRRFVDLAHGNLQLRDDSPAYQLGFKRIPMEKIGCYRDELRASWPVKSTVRPPPEPAPAPAAASLPPMLKRSGPPPVYQVLRRVAAVTIDGDPTAGEWGGDPLRAMLLEQGLNGEKQAPRSLAWLLWDDQALYVAIDNAVNQRVPLRPGNEWGQDDAVELAIRNPAAGAKAPIVILRGFPSGHFESSDEAGTPPAAVKLATRGVEYAAHVVDAGRWTTEWRIPFASLGLDPTRATRYQFSLSVRKTADDQWLMWQGTGACTWEVGMAGVIELH